jgi:nucleotide-binding universal stress UspA family protein
VQASLRDTCGLDFEQQADSGEEAAFAKIIEKAGRQCIDNFMELARGKLKEKKISENRLNLKIVPARFDVAGAILEEFKKQGHGTLVIGKRGMNKRFFMGSVSNYLIRHMENGALCIVP